MLSLDPCNLCPRRCNARRSSGETGYCGARAELSVARSALHFWEEPPISGESGSGTVFFAYCPLRCCYCQNAELAQGHIGWDVSIERLAQMCLALQGKGALNINFVTPTHYSLQIRDAVLLAREQGLHLPIVWNTSGYERVETLLALSDVIDVFLADFKYAESTLAQRYSNAPDYAAVALRAIETMANLCDGHTEFDLYCGQTRMTKGVIVRHLLLPGALDNSKRALNTVWNALGNQVDYSIMNQYTPLLSARARHLYPELAQRPSALEYEELLDYADKLGIEDYYWQDGPTADESFVPSWNGEGVL